METVSISFSQAQLSVLNEALGNMPFKVAAPLIQHINLEIQKSLVPLNDSED